MTRSHPVRTALREMPTATPPVGASNQLTPAQLLNSRSISDLRFSPNGEHVAFVVSEPVKGTTRARHIWLFSVLTKELRQFTNSPKSEDSPRWSPDGKRLAFLSNRDEVRQIYVISLSGGEAKRLIESGAVAIDGMTVKSFQQEVTWQKGMIIKVGKHRIYALE